MTDHSLAPAGTRLPRPTTPADLHRLAALAHERGLRLFRDGPRWYCTSASRPGESYFLTGFSCTCPGFMHNQRCTHHALLLERLGWLPELETETPVLPAALPLEQCPACEVAGLPPCRPVAAPADCPSCNGCGVVVYRSFEERCPDCGGSGLKPDRRLTGQPAVEIVAEAA